MAAVPWWGRVAGRLGFAVWNECEFLDVTRPGDHFVPVCEPTGRHRWRAGWFVSRWEGAIPPWAHLRLTSGDRPVRWRLKSR